MIPLHWAFWLGLSVSCSTGPEIMPPVNEGDVLLRMGGCGGAYFMPEKGELIIDIEKRDRNKASRHTDLRALLLGPDRQVLQEESLEEEGQKVGSGLGKPVRKRLQTRVEQGGVYVLNVTVSQDRYGEEILWGFRTNCERFLIETSRGHKDEPHTEPIVLENSGEPADICFLPRTSSFAIDVSGMAKNSGEIQLMDREGRLLQKAWVSEQGIIRMDVAQDLPRERTPWRLHVPTQPAVIHIEGVTKWEDRDRWANLSLWSPSVESFFPFQEFRWLLTPYRTLAYGRPGETLKVSFQLHNNGSEPLDIRLKMEKARRRGWSASLSSRSAQVAPGETQEVLANVRVSDKASEEEGFTCRLRATAEKGTGFSTYSTLEVRPGVAPATKDLDLPLRLTPYAHENALLGYLPVYPCDNEVYFDSGNRPHVACPEGVRIRGEGEWRTLKLEDGLPGVDWRLASSKVAFDQEDDLYLLGKNVSDLGLIWIQGNGAFHATVFPEGSPGNQTGDIEVFTGHNQPVGPPAVVRFIVRARDPNLIWRRINDLDLFLPEKTSDGLIAGDPIRISDKCIGLANHSGIPATVVSGKNKVHVVWAEATDPEEKVPGVPTYVVTIDRLTRTMGKPSLVGYGPPANDVHNTPSITMDSQGFLHVLVGTHGRTFLYARSLAPDTASEGWTAPEPLGENLSQTYVGLVCDPDDVLHVVFRLWKKECEPYPNSTFATLAHMRKKPGQAWEPPRLLVLPPFSEYSVYYHRLTLDRTGRLFLSYDYWSTYWFYRTDHFGDRRALMMSPDGGDAWSMVQDLAP